MIHLAEEEVSGQENILPGAEKAAAIVKEGISEEHPVLYWDNSQGVPRAKPYPTRAAQGKIQIHLKERHLPWRYFKVPIPFALSLIQNKASLAPAIAPNIQREGRRKTVGMALMWGGKASQKSLENSSFSLPRQVHSWLRIRQHNTPVNAIFNNTTMLSARERPWKTCAPLTSILSSLIVLLCPKQTNKCHSPKWIQVYSFVLRSPNS